MEILLGIIFVSFLIAIVIGIGTQTIYLMRLTHTVNAKIFTSEKVGELAKHIRGLEDLMIGAINERPVAPIVITDSSTIDEIVLNLRILTSSFKELAEKPVQVIQKIETPEGFDLKDEIEGTRKELNNINGVVNPLVERFDEFERLLRQIRGR